MSVCEVTYDMVTERGVPKLGGLSDPRMGPIYHNQRCLTCGAGLIECQGHFGHIELAKPIYHVGFLGIIQQVLKCVCYHCSRLKIDKA